MSQNESKPFNPKFSVGVYFFADDDIQYLGCADADETDDHQGWYVEVAGILDGAPPQFPAEPACELPDDIKEHIKVVTGAAVRQAWARMADVVIKKYEAMMGGRSDQCLPN